MERRGTKSNPIKGREAIHILKKEKKRSTKDKRVEDLSNNPVEEIVYIQIPPEPSNLDSNSPESGGDILENVEKKKTFRKALNIVSSATRKLYEGAKGKTIIMSEWVKNKNKKDKEDKEAEDEEEYREPEYESEPEPKLETEPETASAPEPEPKSEKESIDIPLEAAKDSEYRFVYKDLKYKDGDERFKGEKRFLEDEDFTSKDKRNYFTRKVEKVKDEMDRILMKERYDKVVKSLNENYFKKLLGERRAKELGSIYGEEKKEREREMLEEILASETDPVKRKIIEKRLEKRAEAEEYISEKDSKIRDRVNLNRKRRMYSRQVEAEINRTKIELEELSKNKLPGDEEVMKLLKTKIEMLKRIDREKENKVSKFSKEEQQRRKEKLETPEMKAVFEKYKEDLKKNLLNGGKKVWSGGVAIIGKPLLGVWDGMRALSPSKAFIGFFEGVGEGLVEGVPDIIGGLIKILNAVAIIPIKAGVRYAVAK